MHFFFYATTDLFIAKNMPIVNNLIFRVEDLKETPHNELEQVGNPNLKIFIKDYDVFSDDGDEFFNSINDAAQIASEVKTGRKYIHIGIQGGDTPFVINSSILKTIADSGCSLEIYADDVIESC